MTFPSLRYPGTAIDTVPGRARPSGRYFVLPDDSLYTGKGITAFCLPKRAATGEKNAAEEFIHWSAEMGITEPRIFARVDWTGPPGSGVESGWQYDEDACLWVLQTCRRYGQRVLVTANTGPFGNGVDDCAKQLQRVDELCTANDNAFLECWNEPQQNGGHEFLHQVLLRYRPRTPGWSTGAYDPTPYTRIKQVGVTDKGNPIYVATADAIVGEAMDYHNPRKPEWSRTTKDNYEYETGAGPNDQFSPGFAGPGRLSEPSQVEQTIRDANQPDYWPVPEEDWRAFGAGSKFFAASGYIHGNPDFQRCVVPTDPKVVACVREFVAGFDDVPTQRYKGYNRTDPPGTNPGSRCYHRWGENGREYILNIRPYSFKAI